MCWARSTMQTGVRLQIKVKFERVYNASVDDRSRHTVSIAVSLFTSCREETGMMTFLDNDKSDSGLIVVIQGGAGGTDRRDFRSQDLSKLTLGHTITV